MEKQVERLVPAPDRLARHLSEEIPTEPLSHQAFSLISTVAAAETLRDFAPNGRDFAAERVDRLISMSKIKKYMRLRVSTPTPQTNYRQSHSQVSPHLTHHNTSSLLSLSCITIAESTTEGVVHLEYSIALLLVRGK